MLLKQLFRFDQRREKRGTYSTGHRLLETHIETRLIQICSFPGWLGFVHESETKFFFLRFNNKRSIQQKGAESTVSEDTFSISIIFFSCVRGIQGTNRWNKSYCHYFYYTTRLIAPSFKSVFVMSVWIISFSRKVSEELNRIFVMIKVVEKRNATK